MKKQLSFIAGILFMFASSTLYAQNNSSTIKALAKSIRSHKNIEVSFTYQIVGDPNIPEDVKEGKAYFQNEAYKAILEDQENISDGKTLWQYLIDDAEVMVSDAFEEDNPLSILDELEKDSSGITPVTDNKGDLQKIELAMDDGVRLILNVNEMKYDQDLKKGFFTFDEKAHPNVEIIDMR